MHQDQVDVAGLQLLQRLVNDPGNVLVPHVVNLGGQEDFLSGNTRVLDSLTDFSLVAVCLGAVSFKQTTKTSQHNDGDGTNNMALTYRCACIRFGEQP